MALIGNSPETSNFFQISYEYIWPILVSWLSLQHGTVFTNNSEQQNNLDETFISTRWNIKDTERISGNQKYYDLLFFQQHFNLPPKAFPSSLFHGVVFLLTSRHFNLKLNKKKVSKIQS